MARRVVRLTTCVPCACTYFPALLPFFLASFCILCFFLVFFLEYVFAVCLCFSRVSFLLFSTIFFLSSPRTLLFFCLFLSLCIPCRSAPSSEFRLASCSIFPFFLGCFGLFCFCRFSNYFESVFLYDIDLYFVPWPPQHTASGGIILFLFVVHGPFCIIFYSFYEYFFFCFSQHDTKPHHLCLACHHGQTWGRPYVTNNKNREGHLPTPKGRCTLSVAAKINDKRQTTNKTTEILQKNNNKNKKTEAKAGQHKSIVRVDEVYRYRAGGKKNVVPTIYQPARHQTNTDKPRLPPCS